MKDALISVIMPVYNAQERLEKSIEAVLYQTYYKLELILVDDGSKDHSPEICDGFAQKDPRVRVIHQQNSGVSAARNKGIQKSTGDLIAFVDADDKILPNAYEMVLAEWEEDTDLMVFGMIFDYYKNGQRVKAVERRIDQKICIPKESLSQYFFELHEANYFLPCWNKVFRASVLKDNQILFESKMAILEDFKFVLDFLQKAQRVCALPETYYRYYNNLDSAQIKKRPSINYFENFRILDERIRAFANEISLNTHTGRLNGMILRNYLIAVEKIFSGGQPFSEKYRQMKSILATKEVQLALSSAQVTGARLSLVTFLIRKKCYRLLAAMFFINDRLHG
ncbi:glycosyltransferase family 2 protein [Eubacteriaceae bacterium ES2]|nr:glycosyltransferase family 2 protein [Eubacteriaceae bacterium ES2]